MLLLRCALNLYLIYDKRQCKLLNSEGLSPEIFMLPFQPTFSVFHLLLLHVQVTAALFIFNSLLINY